MTSVICVLCPADVHRKSLLSISVLLGATKPGWSRLFSQSSCVDLPTAPCQAGRSVPGHLSTLQRNVQQLSQLFSFVLYTSPNTQGKNPSTHTRSIPTCTHVSRLNPAFPLSHCTSSHFNTINFSSYLATDLVVTAPVRHCNVHKDPSDCWLVSLCVPRQCLMHLLL